MPSSKKERASAALYMPETRTLESLAQAAETCRACPLWEEATQAVFGEGGGEARLILVGEQPGDQEDRKGRPFVGPAGKLLDRALEEAGIRREEAYVTNVVKHFKFKTRGKRRLHVKPGAREIRACLPWLEAEIEIIRPRVLVALGATAAQAIGGRDVRVTRDRGRRLESDRVPNFTVTIHPSAILRTETKEQYKEALGLFVDDLRQVALMLEEREEPQEPQDREESQEPQGEQS